MPTFETARVAERLTWAEGRVTLVLDRLSEATPGQFLNLGLHVGGTLHHRAYSVACRTGAPLAFYVVAVDGGQLSPHLCRLQPGDELLISPRPLGRFVLDHVAAAPTLWCLATGTGLGPFIGMFRDGTCFKTFERVILVHGVRASDHLAYRAELEQLPLTYVPVLTRESADLTGHLQDILQDGRLEHHVSHPISDTHQVMAVGNPHMVRGVLTALKSRGMTLHTPRRPGQLHVERYW